MTFAYSITDLADDATDRPEETSSMAENAGISDELSLKIFAYVEREAGRDAPLSPDDEKRVRDLLASDPTARAEADDWRAFNRAMERIFEPYKEFAAIAPPEELAPVIRAHMGLMADGKDHEAAELLGNFVRRKALDQAVS